MKLFIGWFALLLVVTFASAKATFDRIDDGPNDAPNGEKLDENDTPKAWRQSLKLKANDEKDETNNVDEGWDPFRGDEKENQDEPSNEGVTFDRIDDTPNDEKLDPNGGATPQSWRKSLKKKAHDENMENDEELDPKGATPQSWRKSLKKKAHDENMENDEDETNDADEKEDQDEPSDEDENDEDLALKKDASNPLQEKDSEEQRTPKAWWRRRHVVHHHHHHHHHVVRRRRRRHHHHHHHHHGHYHGRRRRRYHSRRRRHYHGRRRRYGYHYGK